MSGAFWTFNFTWPAVLGGGLLFSLCLVLLVRELKHTAPSRFFTALQLLRLLIAALLILTLFQPERVGRMRRTVQPVVAVVCDISGSMATRDVLEGPNQVVPRNLWLENQRTNEFWKPLTEKYRVQVADFPSLATNNAEALEQAGTDLNQALADAGGKYDDLRAVLLLSDGDWNAGKAPVSAATALAMRNIPVFGVVVGSDSFLPDIELQSVSAPAYGLCEEHISLPFTVQNRLKREVRTRVTLSGLGCAATSKEITLAPMAQYQDSIILIPRQEGDQDFTISVPLEQEEVFRDNNARQVRIGIRRENLKVLLVEAVPRWEYRFLHNALARDPGVTVSCLLFNPGLQQGQGRDYLSTFPSTKETLGVFDVVFLGDVGIGPGMLTANQAEMLKGLVVQQGSGLVFLPGNQGRQANLYTSALSNLVPVVMEQSSGPDISGTVESRLELTARGANHLLTMLADDPDANMAVWRRLPGFYWSAAVAKAKPGSDVLAVHSTRRNAHGRVPLLVTRSCGNGKVLFLGMDSAWRWRRGVEDVYHYRFWGQVVRWMAHQRHLAHAEGIRFFFSPETPSRGDRVFLHATVLDESGYPIEKGPVEAIISYKGQPIAEKMELTALEEGNWGVFTGSFVPQKGGEYDLEIKCDRVKRSVHAKLVVHSPAREQVGRPARSEVLQEIAAITGAKCGPTAELESILNSIKLLPESKPEDRRFRLWCHPLWAGLIIGLLTLYWVGRKLAGLI